MGLNVSKERTFRREITAMSPVDGGFKEEKFHATFRVLDGDKAAEYDRATIVGTRDFLKQVTVRLDDLVDANDKPVPYSDEVRDQVIVMPWVALALVREYFASVGKAAEGN